MSLNQTGLDIADPIIYSPWNCTVIPKQPGIFGKQIAAMLRIPFMIPVLVFSIPFTERVNRTPKLLNQRLHVSLPSITLRNGFTRSHLWFAIGRFRLISFGCLAGHHGDCEQPKRNA